MNPNKTSSNVLSYTEYGAGQPLLLIHGLMICGEMFTPVIEPFAKKYRVIVPDLRGHGKSRGLPPPYTVTQLASDLANLLNSLGIPSTAIVGYSQGGAIAQQFALDYPQLCNRLVLACTYAYNMATIQEKIEGHLVPFLIQVLGMKKFAKLVISQGLSHVTHERANWIVGLIADQDQRLMIQAWNEAMAFDSRKRLSEIRCQTCIIAGADDTAVPFHHAKMLKDGISHAQLVTVKDTDHALIWEKPDEFVKVVEELLDAASHT